MEREPPDLLREVMGKRKCKYTYKLLLFTLKYIPVLLSLLYIIYAYAMYAGIELTVVYTLSKMSLISWVFMHIATIVFKFCIYHRVFLYYMFIANLSNFLHKCCSIDFGNFNRFLLHWAIAGTVLFIILIIHVTNNKKAITRSDRQHRFWELQYYRVRISKDNWHN